MRYGHGISHKLRKRRHSVRPDINYNMPPNKLRRHKALAKSSPKKYMGLKLTRMYGKPKEVKK